MNPRSSSVSTFLIASVLSMGPVALLVSLPNLWWGILIKCIAVLILCGVAINFLRDFPAKRFIYGAATPTSKWQRNVPTKTRYTEPLSLCEELMRDARRKSAPGR